jgi:hypothetical protein
MHKLMALLIVSVLGSGPTPNIGGKKTFRLTDGVIQVSHNGVKVAGANSGKLRVYLRPGQYSIRASLLPPNPTRPCEVKSVRLKRSHTYHVNLYCSIR